MGKNIDELLNDDTTEETTEVTQETQEPEAEAEAPEAKGQPRDETGKFAKKETDVKDEQEEPAEPGPSPAQVEDPAQGQLAALKAERQKRQEAEARAQAIEDHYRRLQEQAQQQRPEQGDRSKPQKPDKWEEEEAYEEYLIAQAEERALARFRQDQTVALATTSIGRAKEKYADFDTVLNEFSELEARDPSLTERAIASGDPGEFAYRAVQDARQIKQYGSFDDLIKAERAKWEAEAKSALNPSAPLPDSTATDSSVGGRTGPAWSGPKPIGEMLG